MITSEYIILSTDSYLDDIRCNSILRLQLFSETGQKAFPVSRTPFYSILVQCDCIFAILYYCYIELFNSSQKIIDCGLWWC